MEIHNSLEYINKKVKEIKPSLRYNYELDFSIWQKQAKFKLEELLGLPFEKCDDMFSIISKKEEEEYTKIDFEFQSEKDYFVVASLLAMVKCHFQLECIFHLSNNLNAFH